MPTISKYPDKPTRKSPTGTFNHSMLKDIVDNAKAGGSIAAFCAKNNITIIRFWELTVKHPTLLEAYYKALAEQVMYWENLLHKELIQPTGQNSCYINQQLTMAKSELTNARNESPKLQKIRKQWLSTTRWNKQAG